MVRKENQMDRNSTTNQRIKGKFVGAEVLGCFTQEVEYILSRNDYANAPFTYDDIEHFYQPYCADCGEGHTSFTEKENDDGDTVCACDDCGREYSENEYAGLDSEPSEVYEWWAVSGFLAKKLADRGHCTIEGPCVRYWGRCTTGQAILLDGVISDICEEMEILDGQKYSWANMTA